MKVFFVTTSFNKKNREIGLCRIINSFSKRGNFEFYAFATKDEGMESDILQILPAHYEDTVDDCLFYVRYIADGERCFIVFEDNAIPIDPVRIISSHHRSQSGITVVYSPTADGGWKNGGVMLVEGDYLELISQECPLEKSVIPRSAEEGELNVIYL
ncbi:MAG: hypothetical protein IJX51_01820 [Clostridia bacterium]|nr:hypothetical protein [Clostridia bacterium]